MLAEKFVSAKAGRQGADAAKKAEKALGRIARRKARVEAPVLAEAPVPTEEAREDRPVNPYCPTEHVETIRLAAVMSATPNPVTALCRLYPNGADDYCHPDEDEDTLAARRNLNSWLPATPRLSGAECYQAALRAQSGRAHKVAYGPTVTRLARVDTANGQRVEKAFYGRLSAVQQTLPDEETRGLLELARVTGSRGYTPVRMDLYPTA